MSSSTVSSRIAQQRLEERIKKFMRDEARVNFLDHLAKPRPSRDELIELLGLEPKEAEKRKLRKEPRVGWSPNEISLIFGWTLGSTAYHIRKLNELGLIKLLSEMRRKGAVEHYYVPTVRGEEWLANYRRATGTILVETLKDARDIGDSEVVKLGAEDSASLQLQPGESCVLEIEGSGRRRHLLRITR